MPDSPSTLLPRRLLFGNPERAAVRCSPDGRKLSWLAPVEGVLNVWVAPAGDLDAATPVTRDRGRGIRDYCWAYTGEHLLYLQDAEGDENWHVLRVDLIRGDTLDLTPIDGVNARLDGLSDTRPHEALVLLNDRDPRYHDPHVIDLRTGERRLIQENKQGFLGFVTDQHLDLRYSVRLKPGGGSEVLRWDGASWATAFETRPEDSVTTTPLGFDREGARLYWLDSRGRDTAALTCFHEAGGGWETLAEAKRADACGVLRHPYHHHVQAVAFDGARKHWTILDESVRGDLEALRRVSRGDVEVLDRTLDDSAWVVSFLMDDGPTRYYLHDRATKSSTFLFSNRSALEGVQLARMQPFVIRARDGLELVSYLTVPAASDRGDGRPTAPLPAVLLVHGGPWHRDAWGLNPYHQLLANRGYAVLSVNFRGSTGFGKAHLNAAIREWGRHMHDDLMDAVDWMVVEGVALRDRVAIMGASYGGYATLAGLTLTPEVFACGVDIVGPSSLVTLLETAPPYWAGHRDFWKQRVGDPDTEEGRALLVERSPLTHVANICRPLLIAQGANDPRVKKSESDQIVAAMQERGIPVTYALFPDEGHGFARPENSLAFLALAESFLALHLGGRHVPLTAEDVAGSSLQVPAGADGIPGLPALVLS